MLLLGAWQWPVGDFEIQVSFGESGSLGVSPGLKLISGAERVSPAADGELVFAFDGERLPGSGAIPHGLGSFVVLEHEGGFRSVYAHLEQARESLPRSFEEADSLGPVGQSGFSGGNTLGFRIIDVRRDAYVNPLLLLPEFADERAPLIESVRLERAGNPVWTGQGEAVAAGPAELSARIYDPEGGSPYRGDAAPYSVVVFVNGQKEFDVALETLSRHNGRVAFSEEHPVDRLFAPDGRFRLGEVELSVGSNLIEIIAEDYGGNERVETFEIVGASEE
jgi:hypothetical protein